MSLAQSQEWQSFNNKSVAMPCDVIFCIIITLILRIYRGVYEFQRKNYSTYPPARPCSKNISALKQRRSMFTPLIHFRPLRSHFNNHRYQQRNPILSVKGSYLFRVNSGKPEYRKSLIVESLLVVVIS
jgi:hypothetical protein